MDDLAIIDRFTETFSRYIDSGFGLLAGDVAFLTTVLVAIDITLAGIFWAMHGDENVPVQLIRKVLYVGFFALLLNNFKGLADIVFQSFAGLGLKASGTAMTAADLMRPGFVASAGFTASRPLLEKAGGRAHRHARRHLRPVQLGPPGHPIDSRPARPGARACRPAGLARGCGVYRRGDLGRLHGQSPRTAGPDARGGSALLRWCADRKPGSVEPRPRRPKLSSRMQAAGQTRSTAAPTASGLPSG